jgi:YggT family protein
VVVVCLLLQIYYFVLIARVLLSFVSRPPEPLLPLIRGVRAVTDPVLEPLRRLLPPGRVGGGLAIDFAPILLFFAIYLLQSVLCTGRL